MQLSALTEQIRAFERQLLDYYPLQQSLEAPPCPDDPVQDLVAIDRSLASSLLQQYKELLASLESVAAAASSSAEQLRELKAAAQANPAAGSRTLLCRAQPGLGDAGGDGAVPARDDPSDALLGAVSASPSGARLSRHAATKGRHSDGPSSPPPAAASHSSAAGKKGGRKGRKQQPAAAALSPPGSPSSPPLTAAASGDGSWESSLGPLAPGTKVAACVPGADSDEHNWILAVVNAYFADSDTYEVEDEDDDADCSTYRLTPDLVLELPINRTLNLHKGDHVLAMFPETTAFYSARLVRRIRDEVEVEFADDEDERGGTPKRRVKRIYCLPYPSRS